MKFKNSSHWLNDLSFGLKLKHFTIMGTYVQIVFIYNSIQANLYSNFSPNKGNFCPKWSIFGIFAQKGAFWPKMGVSSKFSPEKGYVRQNGGKMGIFAINGVFSKCSSKKGIFAQNRYFRDFRLK